MELGFYLATGSFNSLFEMLTLARDSRTIFVEVVSILCLRCVAIGGGIGLGSYCFNSLFEMRHKVRIEAPFYVRGFQFSV